MTLSQNSFCRLTASDIARATQRGDFRATDVLEACLARIERLDPDLHALITVASDDARARAAELDGMPPEVSGGQLLHGVPVAIKDLVETRGIRTTKGSPRWAQHVPDDDELVVERVQSSSARPTRRSSGSVPCAKTQLPATPSIRTTGDSQAVDRVADQPQRCPPGWYPLPTAPTSVDR